jgi:hypothetical protein
MSFQFVSPEVKLKHVVLPQARKGERLPLIDWVRFSLRDMIRGGLKEESKCEQRQKCQPTDNEVEGG